MIDHGEDCVEGLPLLEVFSITITKNNEDGERRSEIYGKVAVTDSRGTRAILYDRDVHNSESIARHESLTLTGPTRCISALTGFTIDLDIKDANQDFEVKGNICWDMKYACFYDKPLALAVPGVNCCATVNCEVFSVAIQARLEILLKRVKSSCDIPVDLEIYGTVVASYGKRTSDNSQTKYFRTTLFHRRPSNCAQVKMGEAIPLLRSIVAVPAYSSLIVELDLFRGDTKDAILKGATPEMGDRNYICKIGGGGGGGLVGKAKIGWLSPGYSKDFI